MKKSLKKIGLILFLIFLAITLGVTLYHQQKKVNQAQEQEKQKEIEARKFVESLMTMVESAKGESFYFEDIGLEVEVQSDIQRNAVYPEASCIKDMPSFYKEMVTKIVLVDQKPSFDAESGVLKIAGANVTAIRMELSKAYANSAHIIESSDFQSFYQKYKNQLGYTDNLNPDEFFAYSVESYYTDRQPYFEMCDALPYYEYLFSIFGPQGN